MMDFNRKILICADLLCLWFLCLTEPSLAVQHGRPTFKNTTSRVIVVAGSTAILRCGIDNLGKHKVVWSDPFSTVLTHDDRRIIDDDRISLEHPVPAQWNLHIREVTHSDEGLYNCQINTSPVLLKKFRLFVTVPPIINSNSSSDLTVREGDTVELLCSVYGIPTPNVTWSRLEEDGIGEWKKSELCSTTKRVGKIGNVLKIYNITRYCGGQFMCTASNNAPPSVNHVIEVSVNFPPEISMPNKRLGQVLDKETVLECQIVANPKSGGRWYKNDREVVTKGTKYRVHIYNIDSITVIVSLTITFIQEKDYGVYTCVTDNDLGKVNDTMLLYEYKKPTPTTTTTTTTTTYSPRLPRLHYNNKYNSHGHHHKQRPHHHSNQEYQHGSEQVVVKDGRNTPYNSKNQGFPSRYNENINGETGGSLAGGNNGAQKIVTSQILMTFISALIIVNIC